MKTLLFAVLLSIMQAAPPVPRQAPDSANQRTDKRDKKANQHQGQIAPAPTPEHLTEQAISEKASTSNPASPNAQQPIKISELPPVSVTRDWMDKTTWAFGAILLVVGIVGVCAAYRTLRAIERQARIMRRQTTILRESAAATRKAAEAAKTSADAAIVAERAWVMLDIERAPGEGFIMETKGAGGHGTGAHIRLTCSNQGKTPARIIEIRARLLAGIRPLPPEPDLNIEILEAGPFYLQPGMPFVKNTLICGEGGAGIGEMVVIYGVVRYTHLFSAQEVHTTFGYRVTQHRELRRLEGEQYRKYNENT